MRELKFRAWDKSNKRLVDISSIYWGGAMGNVSQTAIKPMEHHLGACAEGDTLVAKRYELMQYTGLNDKNGVEIWEGDIVIANKSYTHAVVEYLPPRFLIAQGDGICDDFSPDEWNDFKVIGNIYQNPELLGGEKEHDGTRKV